jgi:hypothetical protein
VLGDVAAERELQSESAELEHDGARSDLLYLVSGAFHVAAMVSWLRIFTQMSSETALKSCVRDALFLLSHLLATDAAVPVVPCAAVGRAVVPLTMSQVRIAQYPARIKTYQAAKFELLINWS